MFLLNLTFLLSIFSQHLLVNWAKVRFMMFQGQMNLAVIYLDRVSSFMMMLSWYQRNIF